MKIENLVNGYVLPNLFYELIFLDEHGIDGSDEDWENRDYVESVISGFVLPRFQSFTPNTKTVVRNTLRYLLVTEQANGEIWEAIWQASSAPVPTPYGVRSFMQHCYDVIFVNDKLPLPDEVNNYLVNHDPQIANRLN
ncbi:hypothetical protein [Noviherbaspirillum saxi]|uniref:hypothetical protein n=1 Tax=Noviherbaspirillum saxi TaxID=2320863 RepID=UPI0011C48875|nr:hypothetical protein [Noviherbaspirillum saxi]